MRCKRRRISPWVGKIPWRREWQPKPVYLPGKFQGAWWVTIHGVARVWHSWACTHTHTRRRRAQEDQSCQASDSQPVHLPCNTVSPVQGQGGSWGQVWPLFHLPGLAETHGKSVCHFLLPSLLIATLVFKYINISSSATAKPFCCPRIIYPFVMIIYHLF